MINILIVEDEPPILRNICKKIELAGSSYHIAATAYNGSDAITLLKKKKIDIVFTDINMPIMDGLELAKYLYESASDIPCIILTGYQEFSYAQEALRYGVSEYLLKPLQQEVLNDLLEKLSIKITKQRTANSQEALFRAFHNTAPSAPESYVGVHDNLYIFLLCAGSYPMAAPDYLGSARMYWEKYRLEEILSTYFSEEDFYFVLNDYNFSNKIVILSVEKENLLPNKLSSLYAELSTESVPVTAVLSGNIQTMNNITGCINELNRYLYQTIRFGIPHLFLSLMNQSDLSKDLVLEEYKEKKIIYALEQNNYSYFEKEMNELFESLSLHCPTQIKLLNFLIHLTFLCRKHNSSMQQMSNLDMDIEEMVSNQYTYEALIKNFLALMKEFFMKRGNAYASGNKSDLIEHITNYIAQNISLPITNQLLSDHFGLVPSYISKLFKIQKGISPSEYLLKLRIEKAKGLLESSETDEILIKDIAEIVGYTDPLYFSRVFKKETGMYPSAYKSSLSKK